MEYCKKDNICLKNELKANTKEMHVTLHIYKIFKIKFKPEANILQRNTVNRVHFGYILYMYLNSVRIKPLKQNPDGINAIHSKVKHFICLLVIFRHVSLY